MDAALYIILIVLSVTVLIYCVGVLLYGEKGEEREAVRARVNALSRQSRHTYSLIDEELSKPLSERLLKPALHACSRFFARFLPTRRKDPGKNHDTQMRRMLAQAGWSISPDDYMAVQLVSMLGSALAFVFVGAILRVNMSRLLLFFAMGAFAAYAILRFVLVSRGTARRQAIEHQLPDMLDLLSVSVEAGLGFEQALKHITENMEGPLIDEVAVTCREMAMGRTRREAMILLGQRCDVPEVQAFTSALVQAGQLGIPIKNVLRAQSEAIRRSRKAKVQEKASKVSTKILLPMLVFIFPVLFIVLMGPSVLNMMKVF